MPAVPGIDDRDFGIHGGPQRRAFFRMAHGNDICVATDHPCGIRYCFAFGGAGLICSGKAQGLTAQIQHSRFKGQTGSGAGLIEQRCQLFSLRSMGIHPRIDCNPIRKIQDRQSFGIR